MKKMKSILSIPALSLCVLLLAMTAGCSEDVEETTPETEAQSIAETESAAAEESVADDAYVDTTEVVFDNMSGAFITEIDVEPVDGSYEAFDVTEGEGVDVDEMCITEIPMADSLYRLTVYTEDGVLYDGEMAEDEWDLNNNGVMVFPSEYAGEVMSYGGDWGDVDEAEEAVMEALAGGSAEDEQEETSEASDDLAAALEALGYPSLQAYRVSQHKSLDHWDYTDNAYFAVLGYWYPDGDTESLEYVEIDDMGSVRFWRFEDGEDQLIDYTSILRGSSGVYTLDNDDKFTVSDDKLTFEGSDVVYERSSF